MPFKFPLTLGMEGSALKQGPTVANTPAIKVCAVKMRVPIYEPEKKHSSSGQLGRKVLLEVCIINICV